MEHITCSFVVLVAVKLNTDSFHDRLFVVGFFFPTKLERDYYLAGMGDR